MKGGGNALKLQDERFGALTVLERAGSTNTRPSRALWRCRCDCGLERTVSSDSLRAGQIEDCGQHPNEVPDPPALSVAELAWGAGMFEGEGSVRINVATTHNNGALLVDLVNTDETLVRWFSDRFGGSVRHGKLRGNRRPYWRWRAASLLAASFLRAIYPYVKGEKRERVALALEFQAQKVSGWGNRAAAYAARQRDYYERMKRLNHRGARPGSQLLLLPSAERVVTCPNRDQHRKPRT